MTSDDGDTLSDDFPVEAEAQEEGGTSADEPVTTDTQDGDGPKRPPPKHRRATD